jgi:apolipoprotein D and lipocalin family protein
MNWAIMEFLKPNRLLLVFLLLPVAACSLLDRPPVANDAVPEPAKPVELSDYLGLWYEQGRFDHAFEEGCTHATALYAQRADGTITVENACIVGTQREWVRGTAAVEEGSNGAKLKVSFFWPISADYWVLDHAEDYSWSIVGEPSGRYLWILTRRKHIADKRWDDLVNRTEDLGYDTSGLLRVEHR